MSLNHIAVIGAGAWGSALALSCARAGRRVTLWEGEAANAAQLKRNFTGSLLLYVPEVYWDYCRVNVMVMERIHGVPISDIERLRAAGTDLKKLAENGVRIFFTQVFRHNFFHADMHPGNIFVLIDNPAQPRYAAVDFGIVGSLDPSDQQYLARGSRASANRR